jgi:hypothetical protein
LQKVAAAENISVNDKIFSDKKRPPSGGLSWTKIQRDQPPTL